MASEECENLMLKIIETRKCYRKHCIEYKQKSIQCELSLLKLRLNAIAKLKPPIRRHEIPNLPYKEMIREMDDFKNEIAENEKKLQCLIKKVETTENVAMHIKRDTINKLTKEPLQSIQLIAAKSKLQEES